MSVNILLSFNATPTPPPSLTSDFNFSHPSWPNGSAGFPGEEEGGGEWRGGGRERPRFREGRPDDFMLMMRKAQVYGDPVIFTVGMLGNVLAYLVFTRSSFRKVPSVPYLAGIAVADSGFLLTYFLTTLTHVFHLPIMSQTGVCQFGSFANFVCLFLVMWYVVAAVVEKFISVYLPLKKVSLCTVFRAKVVLVSLAVLAIVSYSYIIYFFGPDTALGGVCRPWHEFSRPYQTFMVLDCIVVFIAPLVIVLALVVFILVRGCEYYRISSAAVDFGPRGTSGGSAGGGSGGSSPSPTTPRATAMILALAGLMLVTHLPNSIVRIVGFFTGRMGYEGRMTFIRCSSVVRQLHLLSFAIKFLLYWAVSRGFRLHTKNLLWGGVERVCSLCDRCARGADDGTDPQRISLRGCQGYGNGNGYGYGYRRGNGQYRQTPANACLIQSDV